MDVEMDAGASVLIGVKRSILGIFESKYYRHYQWPETENCWKLFRHILYEIRNPDSHTQRYY